MSSPRDYSLTFGGASTQEIKARGRYIRVLAANVSGVYISPGGSGELLRIAGQGIDSGVAGFDRILVRVTVASTVRLVVSDDRQDDNATNVNATLSATIAPGSTLPAGGDVNCANGVATQLIAADAGQRLTVIVRSSVTNVHANNTVRVGGAGVGAASGIEINVGESVTIDTDAVVAAFNGSGAAVTLQVLPVKK